MGRDWNREAIDGQGIGPAFLGHLVEHGRVMGFLIEKIDGVHGKIGDLEACQTIVKRLHSLGIVHGDLNKYNFIIGPTRTTLIDFEDAIKNGSKEAMQKEFARLTEQLTEETGRGGPCMPDTPWAHTIQPYGLRLKRGSFLTYIPTHSSGGPWGYSTALW